MGVVYEAFDRELGVLVALKCLPSKTPEAALRFKKEFRSLRDLHHENLVVLGELVSTVDQLFFTMELIDGSDIVSYCRHLESQGRRPRPERAQAEDITLDSDQSDDNLRAACKRASLGDASVDESRVRSAFAQLTRGLIALHMASKVHRDVKPSNVLVTRDGRAVLLDFGVVLDSLLDGPSTEARLVGTVGYMSPEQAARERAGFESDWYSVGAMLFEALTDRLPFEGSSAEVLRRKQTELPPHVRQFVPTVDARLDELCQRLLHPDRGQRPSGKEILRTLEEDLEPLSRDTHRSESRLFLGRERELSALNRAVAGARAGRVSLVHIEGQSGSGKTALLADFIANLSDSPDALVLQGRCSERESMPYRAVDGAMDALAEFVSHSTSGEVRAALRAHLLHLLPAFPVFGRSLIGLSATDRAVDINDDPYVQRLNLFRSLRALLAAIREQRMVVIALDDMQWADADSLALLSALVRSPHAPPILVIAASRTQWSERSLLRAWGAETIALSNLPSDDAIALARNLLVRTGLALPASERLAEEVAFEAAGHPLFIHELVRQSSRRDASTRTQVTLDSALWSRVRLLAPRARMLVQLIAVARGPLTLRVLAHAAGGASDDPNALSDLAMLRKEHLLDLDGTAGSNAVRMYHDRVSAAVLAQLPVETQRELHQAIARALELEPDSDAEQLAEHWRGAGMTRVAVGYAITAATRATAALAFGQAARLYQNALEWWPEQPNANQLRELLADALANAGRGPSAAQAYLEASVGVDQATRFDLERRAADQLFRAGHIDTAEPLIRRVLQHMGRSIPDSLFWMIVALLVSRARLLFKRLETIVPSNEPADPKRLAELNACWSVAVGLSMVSNLRGACMQSRHLLLALQVRQQLPLVRALATEAAYVAVRGQSARRRAERLLARTDELASGIDDPYARGFATLSRAICSFLMGDWGTSRALARVAEGVFETRPAGAMWELTSARTFGLWSQFYLGDLAALDARVSDFIHEAETRGDRYAATLHRTGLVVMVWLATDEPHIARQQVLEAEAGWSRVTFDFQRYLNTLGHCLVDLYENSAERAHCRILEIWPNLRNSLYLRIQNVRIEALYMRGVAAIGAAKTRHSQRFLKDARDCAARIAREGVAWATPLALLLRGGIAALRQQPEAAERHWLAAETLATAHDMALFAAAAAYRRALCLDGEAKLEACAQLRGRTCLSEIREPERICALLAPGPDDPAQPKFGGLDLRGRGMS